MGRPSWRTRGPLSGPEGTTESSAIGLPAADRSSAPGLYSNGSAQGHDSHICSWASRCLHWLHHRLRWNGRPVGRRALCPQVRWRRNARKSAVSRVGTCSLRLQAVGAVHCRLSHHDAGGRSTCRVHWSKRSSPALACLAEACLWLHRAVVSVRSPMESGNRMAPSALTPDRSFNRSANGMAPGPRGAVCLSCAAWARVIKRGSSAPAWAGARAAAISAMRIDVSQQGKGLGSAALQALAAWLRRHWPESGELTLSVDEENQLARGAYAKAGFVDLGIREEGRIGWVRYMSKPVEAAP